MKRKRGLYIGLIETCNDDNSFSYLFGSDFLYFMLIAVYFNEKYY